MDDLPTLFRILLFYGISISGNSCNEARGRRFRSVMSDFSFFNMFDDEEPRAVLEAACELVAMTLHNPDTMIEFACALNDEQILLLQKGVSELHSKGRALHKYYASLQSETSKYYELFFTLRRRWINGVTQRRKRANDAKKAREGGGAVDEDGAAGTDGMGGSSAGEGVATPKPKRAKTAHQKALQAAAQAQGFMNGVMMMPDPMAGLGRTSSEDLSYLTTASYVDPLDMLQSSPHMDADGSLAASQAGSAAAAPQAVVDIKAEAEQGKRRGVRTPGARTSASTRAPRGKADGDAAGGSRTTRGPDEDPMVAANALVQMQTQST